MRAHLTYVASGLEAFLLRSPDVAWMTLIAIWLTRIVLLLLMLRTYIIPFIVAFFSERIRVRSISFRSIRGLYIRTGSKTWRVDRIVISRPTTPDGLSRIFLTVEGLKVEFDDVHAARTSPASSNAASFRLADFGPSPMAFRLWFILSSIYDLLSPLFRPIVRTIFVSFLRHVIERLPGLSQALDFRFRSAELTFTSLPGARILLEEADLRTALSFSQEEQQPGGEEPDAMQQEAQRPAVSFSLADWQSRMTTSTRRSWDRAWGKTLASASVSLKVKKVAGLTSHSANADTFMSLPGTISLDASIRFNPKHLTISRHGLDTTLRTDAFFVSLDAIRSLLKSMNTAKSIQFQDTPAMVLGGAKQTPSATASGADSHLIGAISASVRARRGHRVSLKPLNVVDAKNTKSTKLSLSFLKSASVHIPSIKLVSRVGNNQGVLGDTYEAVIDDVFLHAKLSDPSHTPLHLECLGRKADFDDNLEPDSYALTSSFKKVTLHRTEQRQARAPSPLLGLSQVEGEVLLSQWPRPWLATSQFLAGDPNAPLIALRLHIDRVDITESLESMQRLISSARTPTKPDATSQSSSGGLIPMPRFTFALNCGKCSVSLVFNDPLGESDCPSVELATDGFLLSGNSEFLWRQRELAYNDISAAFPDCLPLQFSMQSSMHLKPTFVRVRANPRHSIRGHDLGMSPPVVDALGEPVLSLEALDVHAVGSVLGGFECDRDGLAVIDSSSMFLDVHCLTDVLSIELWHPDVIASMLRLSASLSQGYSGPRTPTTPTLLLDGLPTGLFATLAISRFVIFVTSPDLNPKDNLQISRGFGFRTGCCLQYSALRPCHVTRFKSEHTHWQTRSKLYLPEERIVQAVAAAKAFPRTQDSSAFSRLSLWDVALRSGTATPYVPDDPHFAERDDPLLKAEEFVRIGEAKIELSVSSKRATQRAHSEIRDRCQLAFHVPYAWATFKLIHAYNLLLGIRTLRLFRHERPSAGSPMESNFGQLPLRVQGTIKTAQFVWALHKQRAITPIDSIVVHSSGGEPARVRWNTVRLWVPLSPVACTDRRKDEQWQELLRMNDWGVSLFQPLDGPPRISVEGDAARLRIPFAYVVSELISDAIIASKCVRHLARMVRIGQFTNFSSPVAEPAKTMPIVSLTLRCLCAEASDDSLESRLALIWRVGLEAAKQRLDREEAFKAKIAAILAAEFSAAPAEPGPESEYQFDPGHTVTLDEARERLDRVHALDWSIRHKNLKSACINAEEAVARKIVGPSMQKSSRNFPTLVGPAADDLSLFRLVIHGLSLRTSPASFAPHALPDYLYSQGKGIPRETSFSLLLPMHLTVMATSLRATLRDYPLPLLLIPPHSKKEGFAFRFDSDLVIAEELGTSKSVDWVECKIIESSGDVSRCTPLSFLVPKTAMPVKTYANPSMTFMTDGITVVSWGVSYAAPTQDLMRVVETLTTPSSDLSPVLGFWDKIRLVFHWKIEASFRGEVRLHMKGSRDPYQLLGNGAGFVFCWKGCPKVLIGHPNDDNELLQVTSESMIMAIPEFEVKNNILNETALKFQKVCAKLGSGVRFGVGFILERACGHECRSCNGPPFSRTHRIFDFPPHHAITLDATKILRPSPHSPDDSYSEFRSDFVHLSISLISPTQLQNSTASTSTSLHLTPNAFAHFWSWWALFDDALSLPIRQGSYYPPRPPSPKLGRHLATIKYRISVANLFITHVYADNSKGTWLDGVTPFVGAKAMIKQLEADMHQRLSEAVVPGNSPNSVKLTKHRPFYAAEVALKDLDLRLLLAIFHEPLKQSVPVPSLAQRRDYWSRKNLPAIDPQSCWVDPDDFVETDYSPSTKPVLHLLPVAACPHFTYFKRSADTSDNALETTKFGAEDTHTCLIGKETPVTQVQVKLAAARICELKATQAAMISKAPDTSPVQSELPDAGLRSLEKKIALLQNYINQVHCNSANSGGNSQNYFLPSDLVGLDEWSEFNNVYQIHCPKIFMDTAIRDIAVQYYYCSRAIRGLEYHMAQRAVKFVRDQAEAAITTADIQEEHRAVANPAQAAATALRKIFTGDGRSKASIEVSESMPAYRPGDIDPLRGWFEGVSLRKSHFCLLLKPQIVLRGEAGIGSACVLAAVQAKLQSFNIMDDLNAEDPVCGTVMTRSYTSLTGLQAFSPATTCVSIDGCVPLEILIDLRCESDDFDRLVPQTDATFHYDRFNRLRLRNNVTSATRTGSEQACSMSGNHLHNQTDLIQVNVPRFTVSATDHHFRYISHIVTKLILFSDAAHKTRLEKLEALLFTYDFTDLACTASVIEDLQGRLRSAIEIERIAELDYRLTGNPQEVEILKLKAHISFLAEELGLLFDVIKLAQDRIDEHTDQKSALLLHTTSAEISWHMLDERRELLAKLAVRDIDYSWLSRRDSSTVNNLTVGDLQAFDGSPRAVWTEILCKATEPANHPLLKRGIFILGNWTVLAPVGGITIYENFEVNFHPMRLQVDARVGVKIMEYVWPARKHRKLADDAHAQTMARAVSSASLMTSSTSRASLDSPPSPLPSPDPDKLAAPLRKVGASRSFTDLRTSFKDHLEPIPLQRTRSSQGRHGQFGPPDNTAVATRRDNGDSHLAVDRKKRGDAAEMRTRSSQKTFVLVRISSLDVVLSIMKEESFECRGARIRTRDLEYRNQTWSFEELVNQFIPSDMSWRGWVKMVFHQPLVPVLPVARELFTKTKWIASKGSQHDDEDSSRTSQMKAGEGTLFMPRKGLDSRKRWHKRSSQAQAVPLLSVASASGSESQEHTDTDGNGPNGETLRSSGRVKLLHMLTRRGSSRARRSVDNETSSSRFSTSGLQLQDSRKSSEST